MDRSRNIHKIFLNVDLMGLNDGFGEGSNEEEKANSFQTSYLSNKVYSSVIHGNTGCEKKSNIV